MSPAVLIFFETIICFIRHSVQHQGSVDLNVNGSGCGQLMSCLQGWAPLPYMAFHSKLHLKRIRLRTEHDGQKWQLNIVAH